MRVFIFFLFMATTSATFHRIKPDKLYHTLLEPFVDVALKGIVSSTIIEPIGKWITRGRKKRKFRNTKHHKHYEDDDDDYEAYSPHYHYEKEIYLHHGDHPHHEKKGHPAYPFRHCDLAVEHYPFHSTGHVEEPFYPLGQNFIQNPYQDHNFENFVDFPHQLLT